MFLFHHHSWKIVGYRKFSCQLLSLCILKVLFQCFLKSMLLLISVPKVYFSSVNNLFLPLTAFKIFSLSFEHKVPWYECAFLFIMPWICWAYFCDKTGVVVVIVQSLSHVQLFAASWTAACWASLSLTISWSLLKQGWHSFKKVTFTLTCPSSLSHHLIWTQLWDLDLWESSWNHEITNRRMEK